MKAEVRVYSGQRNPTWKLSQKEDVELLAKISSFNSTERDPIDMGLGYNGFIITRTAEESSNLPEEIQINNGIILVNYGNNRLSKHIDPARSLEKWILRVGSQYLDPRLVEYIKKKI